MSGNANATIKLLCAVDRVAKCLPMLHNTLHNYGHVSISQRIPDGSGSNEG